MALPVRQCAEAPQKSSAQIILEMDAALDEEKLAVRKNEEGRQITLPAGQYQGADGAFHGYSFSLAQPHHLCADQDVEVVLNSRRLACTVVREDGLDILVALPCCLGPEIPAGGILVVDTVWMIEALQRRLRDGVLTPSARQHGTTPFNVTAALRVIGQGDFAPSLAPPVCETHLTGTPLNEEQAHAVELTFRRNASYIIGPPGTGKTTTLARAVEAHVRAGRSVLVVAPSNRAVDIVMRAVAERLRECPEYSRGLIIRFGPRPTTAVLGRISAEICHGDLVDRILRERYDKALARLDEIRDAASATLASVDTIEAACCSPLGPYPTPAYHVDLRKRGCRATSRLLWVKRHQRRVRRASDVLPRRLLGRCMVLGTTIHQTYLSRELRRQYDVVVIDEASMMQAAQAFVAAGLAETTRGRVIVAGDYRQIPPVVLAESMNAKQWLARDVFYAAGIPDDLAREDYVPYVALLNVQYRMSPGICKLVSDLFYEGRLKPHPSVRTREALPCPFGTTDVYFIDSSSMAPSVPPAASRSRVNEKHITIVEALLAELDSGNAIPTGGRRNVAVISPFRDQTAAIRQRVATRYRGRGIVVTTAHRSQGGEAEIVILDLTDAPGPALSGFLQANDLSSTGPRVLNVAMSRARQQLYVIGAMEYLERTGGRVAKDLILYLRNEAQRIKLAQIMGVGAAIRGDTSRHNSWPPATTASISPVTKRLGRGGK